jgi:cytochrome c oxidase subunit 1
MINAGMNINYLVHNTLWVVGHFHMTVGTAVALSFMAATYWFLPIITGREIFSRRLGMAQVLLWFLGMVLMGNAMHRAGLAGIPRRTADPTYEQVTFETAFGAVSELRLQIALGGVLLSLSLLLFFIHLVLSGTRVGSMVGSREKRTESDVIPPALSGPEHAPKVLSNLKLWTAIALALIVLTYVLPLASIIDDGGLFGTYGTVLYDHLVAVTTSALEVIR